MTTNFFAKLLELRCGKGTPLLLLFRKWNLTRVIIAIRRRGKTYFASKKIAIATITVSNNAISINVEIYPTASTILILIVNLTLKYMFTIHELQVNFVTQWVASCLLLRNSDVVLIYSNAHSYCHVIVYRKVQRKVCILRYSIMMSLLSEVLAFLFQSARKKTTLPLSLAQQHSNNWKP